MRRAPWFVLSFLVAACTATGPTVSINGRAPHGTWYLSEFRLSENQPARAPRGAAFTLNLDEEGKASGQVACNRWHGRYSLLDSRLALEGVARTRARCLIDDTATAEIENYYLPRLESGADFRLRDDQLELVFADGLRWSFQRR